MSSPYTGDASPIDFYRASTATDPFGDASASLPDVSRWLGLTSRTLRHWINTELVTPEPSEKRGQRLSRADRDQIRRICGWRARGWSLLDIYHVQTGARTAEDADAAAWSRIRDMAALMDQAVKVRAMAAEVAA